MTEFTEMPENEVIILAKKMDNDAIEFIVEKYKPLVRKKARNLFLQGGETDDLIQEGMIGLFKAIQSYDINKNVIFSTFASICIVRQMQKAIEKSMAQKNIPLNTYVSLNKPDDGHKNIDDDISYKNQGYMNQMNKNPEEILITKETNNFETQRLYNILSSTEKKVFELFMEGYTYVEIATQLNKSPKAIDNSIQRIKAKNQKLIHLQSDENMVD